ncbi:MAG: hypothetical protein ACFCVC_12020 [Acidimicrobiia bacterium]
MSGLILPLSPVAVASTCAAPLDTDDVRAAIAGQDVVSVDSRALGTVVRVVEWTTTHLYPDVSGYRRQTFAPVSRIWGEFTVKPYGLVLGGEPSTLDEPDECGPGFDSREAGSRFYEIRFSTSGAIDLPGFQLTADDEAALTELLGPPNEFEPPTPRPDLRLRNDGSASAVAGGSPTASAPTTGISDGPVIPVSAMVAAVTVTVIVAGVVHRRRSDRGTG